MLLVNKGVVVHVETAILICSIFLFLLRVFDKWLSSSSASSDPLVLWIYPITYELVVFSGSCSVLLFSGISSWVILSDRLKTFCACERIYAPVLVPMNSSTFLQFLPNNLIPSMNRACSSFVQRPWEEEDLEASWKQSTELWSSNN